MARLRISGMERVRFGSMSRSRLWGYALGILAALSWAISPILIRKGLATVPPLWGVAIGMVTATALSLAWVRVRRPAGPPGSRDGARSLAMRSLLLAGVFSAFGVTARTVALDLAPVVVVMPLAQTASFFTLVFAPLALGRHVERVTLRLVVGVVLVVGGSALVIVGQAR
jgi:drug/metabolite transporter (DMT)-like permease